MGTRRSTTIAQRDERIRETYGDEAMTVHYASGVDAGQIQVNPGQAPDEPLPAASSTTTAPTAPRIFPLREPTLTAVAPTAARCSPFRMASWWSCSGTARRDTRMSGAGHTHDLAAMRKATGCKVICIDPRMSDTVCGQGGEWIPIRPGTDGALCAALAIRDHQQRVGRRGIPAHLLRRLRRGNAAGVGQRQERFLQGLHSGQRPRRNAQDAGMGRGHHAGSRAAYRRFGAGNGGVEAVLHLSGLRLAAPFQRRDHGARPSWCSRSFWARLANRA